MEEIKLMSMYKKLQFLSKGNFKTMILGGWELRICYSKKGSSEIDERFNVNDHVEFKIISNLRFGIV